MTDITDPIQDDEWSQYVMNGQAFAAEALVVAVPAMIPELQILNPVASGIRLRLRAVEPIAFAGGAVNNNLRRHDVALINLQAPPFGAPQNLLGGGPAPAAEFRHDNVAVLVGSPFWLMLTAGFSRRNYAPKMLEWSHDLLEGQGFMASGIVSGLLIYGFQWAEIPL